MKTWTPRHLLNNPSIGYIREHLPDTVQMTGYKDGERVLSREDLKLQMVVRHRGHHRWGVGVRLAGHLAGAMGARTQEEATALAVIVLSWATPDTVRWLAGDMVRCAREEAASAQALADDRARQFRNLTHDLYTVLDAIDTTEEIR